MGKGVHLCLGSQCWWCQGEGIDQSHQYVLLVSRHCSLPPAFHPGLLLSGILEKRPLNSLKKFPLSLTHCLSIKTYLDMALSSSITGTTDFVMKSHSKRIFRTPLQSPRLYGHLCFLFFPEENIRGAAGSSASGKGHAEHLSQSALGMDPVVWVCCSGLLSCSFWRVTNLYRFSRSALQ